MSGIAGIFHLDRSPIDVHTLQRMTNAIAYRGKDGAATWVDGSVGLGHRMLRTTPEALHERQPLCDESGKVCLVLDGRVDNREDLGKTLKSKGAALRDGTDAELILKSYLQWGEDAPIHILGDFAFAVWDGRHGALFCARDVFGIRSLNYYCGGNFVLIASELHQLFHDPRVRRVARQHQRLDHRITWGSVFRFLQFRAQTVTRRQDVPELRVHDHAGSSPSGWILSGSSVRSAARNSSLVKRTLCNRRP